MTEAAEWVTIKKFAEVTGYSEKAVRRKQERNDWPKDRIWKKAPDGRILLSLKAYYAWVDGDCNDHDINPRVTTSSQQAILRRIRA